MRNGITALAMCIALQACVSTSEIVPMGRDSYTIDSRSLGGLNAGKERLAGLKAANQFCDSKGLHMIVRRSDPSGVAGVTPVRNSLIFSCVGENDPEYGRPNLRNDPNVLIEDQRK